MSTKYISHADTNKKIRIALRAAFSGAKFSVTKYGGTTYVKWTGGPTEKEVRGIVDYFAGATFDGMTDTMDYRYREEDGVKVHYGADFISVERTPSAAEINRATAEITEDGHEGIDPGVWNEFSTRYGVYSGYSDGLYRYYIREALNRAVKA